MEEIMLVQGEDGLFREYKPYATIEIETEEDFNALEEALKLYRKVKSGKVIVQEVDDGKQEE